jgi:hypothetical protein
LRGWGAMRAVPGWEGFSVPVQGRMHAAESDLAMPVKSRTKRCAKPQWFGLKLRFSL